MSSIQDDYVRRGEFYEAIAVLQKNLTETIETMGKDLEQKLEQKLEEKHEETRVHLGAMIEDAEERFLKTSHDQVSLNGDRIDKHEERIGRLETVVGVA